MNLSVVEITAIIAVGMFFLAVIAIIISLVAGHNLKNEMKAEQKRHDRVMEQNHFHFQGEVFMRDKEYQANQENRA